MRLTRRALCLALAALPFAVSAGPRRYALDPAASRIGFSFSIDGLVQTGSMPIETAQVQLDPADLAAARVEVSLLAAEARTGIFIATQALRGPLVLDTERHPRIRFASTAVALGPTGRLSEGARLTGDLTVRGMTRPVTLNAGLFRPSDSAADAFDRLTVVLRGSISRSAFGASGYPELVDDAVGLDIRARIVAV